MKWSIVLLLVVVVCAGMDCQGNGPAALATNVDTDSDGLSDNTELAIGTSMTSADTDADGLSDGDEVLVYSTDPTFSDTDFDGLSDGDEVNVYLTDPLAPDTDDDGLSDGDEVNIWSTNPLLADTDADGLLDGAEIDLGLDPLCPDVQGTVVQVLCSDFIVVQSSLATGVYTTFGTPIGFATGFLVGDSVVLECDHGDYEPTGYVRVNLRSGETGFHAWLGPLTDDGGVIDHFWLNNNWYHIVLSNGRDYILFPSDGENLAVAADWHAGQRVEIVQDAGSFYDMVNVNLCEMVGVTP